MENFNRAPITVLLVDDHAIVRTAVRMLLEATQDVQVVGEAADGHEAVLKVQELCPKVVLLDVSLPVLSGQEAARRITRRFPKTKVVALTAHDDSDVVRDLIDAGVSGYLTKDVAAQHLLQAIQEVSRGGTFFSPGVSRVVFGPLSPAKVNGEARPRAELTRREMDVFQLVAEGHSNRGTAARLNISIKTVEKHRQKIMDKLHIHEVAGLTRYALSRGIVHCGVSHRQAVPKHHIQNETEMRQVPPQDAAPTLLGLPNDSSPRPL